MFAAVKASLEEAPICNYIKQIVGIHTSNSDTVIVHFEYIFRKVSESSVN